MLMIGSIRLKYEGNCGRLKTPEAETLVVSPEVGSGT